MAHEINTAAALWQNIQTLMRKRYGEENLSSFATDCGFAQSTASRIKAQQTATGLDKLDMIARAFGLATWQLLVPGLDPDHPPTLQSVSKRERELYERFRAAAKEFAANESEPGKYL
jgi:hypothetical protein